MDTPLFLFLFHALFVYGVLSFGSENGFRLTASRYIFVPNDNVTFTCTKGSSGDGGDERPRDLVFPSNAGITWERNGQSLFSTTTDGDTCHVRPETVLGRPVVTQRDLEAVTCTEDDTSVRVTIRNVTVSAAGDRWVCSKFPFHESNSVDLHNFVPLTDVTLSVQDHYPDDVNTGVLMTLVCLASPCSPRPSLTWRLQSRDGHVLPLPDQKRTHAQVDRYGRVVLAVELGLRADPIYENATVTCSGTNALNNGGQATPVAGGGDGDSNNGNKEKARVNTESVKLTVKRPPRILLTVSPANEVTEGTVVTLTCGVHGHPRPEVRWRKEGGFLPGGLMEARTPIIRLNPARAPDRGQYTCRAFNGVQPEAANSVYLTVNEPERELEVSDENRTTEVTEGRPDSGGDREENSASNDGKPNNNYNDYNNNNNNNDIGNSNDNNNDGSMASKRDATSSAHGEDDDDDDGASGGTIAAIVISVLVLLACVALFLLWLITRRGKQGLTSPSSIVSLFPRFAEKTMTAPRAGLYVPRRASQRPTTMTPMTLDAFPQYLELPPAPSPPVGILNRGYGMPDGGSKVVRGKGGRPLPAAPIATDDITTNPLTYGYEEIHDVSNDEGRAMTSADGYEVPVLLAEEDDDMEHEEWEDEDEEEGIYDVPRKGLSAPGETSGSAVQARTNAMYMNDDSFNTHM